MFIVFILMNYLKTFSLLLICKCSDEVNTNGGENVKLITEQPKFKGFNNPENINNSDDENNEDLRTCNTCSELCFGCFCSEICLCCMLNCFVYTLGWCLCCCGSCSRDVL